MIDKLSSGGGLYRPEFEKDNCGFGIIADLRNNASHWLIKTSATALARLSHRGAIAADGKSGDGCGLLFAFPKDFFKAVAIENGFNVATDFAVGTIFLHQNKTKRTLAISQLEQCLKDYSLELAGWRDVPIDKSYLGKQAEEICPNIKQIFVNMPATMNKDEFDRILYVVRKDIEKRLVDDDCFYVVSLSSRIICYKGLVTPKKLTKFYLDLEDKRITTTLCLFHQRFSTNTMPQWRLAQPFRYLAHNGEINTIKGNRNWLNSKNERLFSDKLRPFAKTIMPVVTDSDSDSCSLDNAIELLHLNGMELHHALRILIPPAWQNMEHIDTDLKAFYEYYAMHMGSWDGPAGVVTTDGRYGICGLDRNGLRPARWVITKDQHITLASEIGVYDYAPEDVIWKGRLGPGEMFVIDTLTGRIMKNDYINDNLKSRKPYKKWLQQYRYHLQANNKGNEPIINSFDLNKLHMFQKMFGVSFEELEQVIKPLVIKGIEPTGSMGDDAPIAVLSKKERSIYDYFRQQFAQVTNPPIDSLREKIVMSLKTYIGKLGNIFDEDESLAKRLVVDIPVLSESKFSEIIHYNTATYPSCRINLNYPIHIDIESALQEIIVKAIKAVNHGNLILILDDEDIAEDKYPVNALLATGAVHHALIKANLRCYTNIIVKTATARDSHHMATLLAYGATAIYPYLVYQSLGNMLKTGAFEEITSYDVVHNYRKGIKKGLYKIMSKMGISTMTSYRGAQLFEIVGLNREIVDLCFCGTVSQIEGASFTDLQEEQISLAKKAFLVQSPIDHGGRYRYVHNGEAHAFNPEVIYSLHKAVCSGKFSDYCKYRDLVNNRSPLTLRDLMNLKPTHSIDIEKVEPISAILSRFDGAGMSLGALSPEAHEALAVAMNRLGGRSNSGEGGEDKSRYNTEKVSKIKQIASGRFGVTPEYLMSAEVVQIKIAQGAKPGEGGQLPGHKVNKMIAKLRYATPGVPLISPPPHHDIYSIEDLAQLIYDIKQLNPKTLVSVKLVSRAGVGTIAAGVTKAYADMITISGHDGGTAASPLTSIVYAGAPWEIGLSETQETLCKNKLRNKIRLQVDGGLKTGLDIIKGAILGAESFGFGSVPMIALGCKYLRICHLNNCATGVATQNQTLREQHFHGTVEKLINYFNFIAQDVRQILASLGIAKLTDLIGRTDLLELISGETSKQQGLNLKPILTAAKNLNNGPQHCTTLYNKPFGKQDLSDKIMQDVEALIKDNIGGIFSYNIQNIDRSIGASISGLIATHYGNAGMSNPINLYFKGSAGQSFGVFNVGGLHLSLEGDANDYVGKGMAGGEIIIRPPNCARYESQLTPIAGNTCLYGATGGTLYASGTVGERFGVRNSGALAIVEGAGDHCCEYMTGGVVLVLGKTGVNFGAGMTGGVAYVLDEDNTFVDRYNHELVNIHRVQTEQLTSHRNAIYNLIQDFVEKTESSWGKHIIDNYEDYISKFWMIIPISSSSEMAFENVRDIA